jgi:opacity protein-like surface antigen
MSIYRGILLAGASLIASTLVAQSADLYKTYGGRGSLKDDFVHAAPRGCPSWYARLDGGYVSYDRPSMSQLGIDDLINQRIEDTGSLGGGIGYYFRCNIRGDITIDHRFESDVKGFNANPFAPNYGGMKWGYSSTAYMANMYYDFNAGARFTPYIGFGLGMVNNHFAKGGGVVAAGSADPLVAGNPTSVGGADSWHVAGAAMAGFVLSVTDRLKLDTGYRFLYLGAAKTGETMDTVAGGVGGRITADNLHAHEFRIGLRYDIR